MQASKKESNLYRSVSPLCSYVASLPLTDLLSDAVPNENE